MVLSVEVRIVQMKCRALRGKWCIATVATLAMACESSTEGTTAEAGAAGVAAAAGNASAAAGGVIGVGGFGVGGASASSSGAPAGGRSSEARLDAALIGNAAVILGSCLPDDGINRNALYLWNTENAPSFWHHFARAAECLVQTIQGCTAVERCLGWHVEDNLGPCEPSCAGSVFSVCSDGSRVSIDCAKLDMACDVQAICSDEPSAPCDADTFERSCTADGLPVYCNDDAVFRGPSCESFGLRCEAGFCVGTGLMCSGEAPDDQGAVYFDGVSCSGNELAACIGNRAATRDCASMGLGFGCQSVDGEAFCGLASECLPALGASRYGEPERCDGTDVIFCNAGRLERVDCRALGFTGCDVEAAYGCTPGL